MNQLLILHKFLGRIRNIQGSALPHQNREDSVGQYAFEELDAVCDTLGYSSLRLDSIFYILNQFLTTYQIFPSCVFAQKFTSSFIQHKIYKVLFQVICSHFYIFISRFRVVHFSTFFQPILRYLFSPDFQEARSRITLIKSAAKL